MQAVMRNILSLEGYDHYLLATEEAVWKKTAARLKHLFVATAQIMPVIAIAAGLDYSVRVFSKGPIIGYCPPRICPGRRHFDPWGHHKQVAKYVFAPSLAGLAIGSHLAYKYSGWTAFKRNVHGIWDPAKVAQEAYRQEFWQGLSKLIIRVFLVAAAVLVLFAVTFH